MIPEDYQLFSHIMANNEKVKLINIFHGVPVNYNAEIIDIRGDEIRMRTHPLQLICIRNQKKSYINYKTKTFRADALSTDMKNETTLLTHFETAQQIGLRKNVRVEPHLTTQVAVTSEKFDKNKTPWITTTLADVSIKGIAINTNTFLFNMANLTLSDPLTLKFILSVPEAGINFSILLEGIIRSIFKNPDKRTVRIGVELFPDKNNESMLTRYIAQRQKDILKELKEIREKDIFTD